MGCSCKQVKKLEEKYGVEKEETLFSKMWKILYKVFIFLISVTLGLIVIPITLIVALFKTIFTDNNRLTLPYSLVKFVKKLSHG